MRRRLFCSVTRFGEILPLWQKKSDYLAIFLGLVGIWQHFEPTLANQLISIGQVFMVVKPNIEK